MAALLLGWAAAAWMPGTALAQPGDRLGAAGALPMPGLAAGPMTLADASEAVPEPRVPVGPIGPVMVNTDDRPTAPAAAMDAYTGPAAAPERAGATGAPRPAAPAPDAEPRWTEPRAVRQARETRPLDLRQPAKPVPQLHLPLGARPETVMPERASGATVDDGVARCLAIASRALRLDCLVRGPG